MGHSSVCPTGTTLYQKDRAFNGFTRVGPNKHYDNGDDRFHPDNLIIIKIDLPMHRDRTNSDFAFYKKKVYDYFFELEEDQQEKEEFLI